MNIDARVINLAPDSDTIKIVIGEFLICIERDQNMKVYVSVLDNEEGSEMRLVLGEEGLTHKL